MKKFVSLLFISAFAISLFGQDHILVPQHLRNIRVKKSNFVTENRNNASQIGEKEGSMLLTSEEIIGNTRYDNQSNASIPKKIYFFEDATIGATWTRSMDELSFFADRGTGYNYFDGTTWQPAPTQRVEDIKVHRPVYAPFGENGELILSHTSGAGLYLATRTEKGTGDWNFETLSGPPGEDYVLWCRLVTSGSNHDRIHILSLTLPTSHGGFLYDGLDGALLYSLSPDGGNTWEIDNEILNGMTTDDYNGFAADIYAFAEPVGDNVAFVVGDPWTGLFLMKSTDGGENFNKTVIWDHPYPGWEFGMPTDTFYCADGSQSVALDNMGRAHVAFGINRVQADDNSTYWYPWVDGIAYWNEDMPTFSNDLNALNPNDHPDSELIKDYNLIGWSQDVDGSGDLEFESDMGLYWIGLSSMPQLVIDDEDQMFLVYSSVTETYSNGSKNYRHLWMRAANNLGQFWSAQFIHLTEGIVHIFDECVYPALAANSDDYLYMIYQYDTEPGTAVWGAQHSYVDNKTAFLKYNKADFPLGLKENAINERKFDVSQNAPNPFSGNTEIIVRTYSKGILSLNVYSLEGRLVYSSVLSDIGSGEHHLNISASELIPGMYFYTISDGLHSVSKKMIVE